jgi:putative nucleotidyltransferase with HDIG domain
VGQTVPDGRSHNETAAGIRSSSGSFRPKILSRMEAGTESAAGTFLAGSFLPVSLEGLDRTGLVDFPLYLQTRADHWVLYRESGTPFDTEQVYRLRSEGVDRLFVHRDDRARYFGHVETCIDRVVRDRAIPVAVRGELYCGVVRLICEEIFESGRAPDTAQFERAGDALAAGSAFLLREHEGLRAVRRQLDAEPGLAEHSMAVALLSMGLAIRVLGRDPEIVRVAGLAGLFHDVGRIDGSPDDDDLHVRKGPDLLRSVGAPRDVIVAACHHHERIDGSGWPEGLTGDQVPLVAQVVGLADSFDRIYRMYYPQVRVYEALRILAEVYGDCFDAEVARRFIGMFR